MLNKRMQDALNDQIKYEMYSANLYLAMSAYIENKGLKGTAKWLRVQYEEETFHALKLYDYVKNRNGQVELKSVDAPPAEFGSLLETFQKVLEHEQQVTARINTLYKVAIEENDFAAQIFLQWFVNEQVEEESNASEVISKLELIGDRKADLLYLDTELGTRVFVPPTSTATAISQA
ncbi:MAG: ftnA [Firmicutes bacterium]|nr:ftnA [Bacillota bacterium]